MPDTDLPKISPLLARHHGVPEKEGAREMLPAMTRNEWEHVLSAGWPKLRSAPGTGEHAHIARALYGQPFGFTQEDVDLVLYGNDAEDMTARRNLAARIAAMLPPPEAS